MTLSHYNEPHPKFTDEVKTEAAIILLDRLKTSESQDLLNIILALKELLFTDDTDKRHWTPV